MNSLRFRLHRTSQVGNIRKNTSNNVHQNYRRTVVSSFRPQGQRSKIRCYHGVTQRQKAQGSTPYGISYRALCVPAAVCLVAPSSCEAAWNEPSHASNIQQTRGSSYFELSSSRWKQLRQKVFRALRLFARVVKLMLAVAPVAALYPIQRLTKKKDTRTDAHDIFLDALKENGDKTLGWYFRLCLYSVEWSGAAVIKLMQWASSRPDLFGDDFCVAFSKLQDDTTPHAMKHTVEVMRQAHGDDWAKRIRLEPKVVGSGCIGQGISLFMFLLLFLGVYALITKLFANFLACVNK